MKRNTLWLSVLPALAGTALYFSLLCVCRTVPALRDADPGLTVLLKLVRIGLACLVMEWLGARPYRVFGFARRDIRTAIACVPVLGAVYVLFRLVVPIWVPSAVSVQTEPNMAAVLSAVIVAPVTEELFFRGYIGKSLTPCTTAFACIFSSTVFALSHTGALSMIYAFLCGIILFLCAHRTQKLMLPILLHALLNAASIWL